MSTWLFPRYIGIVYIEPSVREASSFARGRMLDIGCGTRRYEWIFKDAVHQYIGLDWPQLESRALPDVMGDAMMTPFADASFDVVLATELMEHLPSPEAFLREVARLLKPGGAVIMSVPFLEPLHEEPRDFYRFTPHSLRLLLGQQGFSIRKLWKKGGWWSVVLGSFINQAIYDWATSLDSSGQRTYGIMSYVVLPVCAAAQWLAYHLDKLFGSNRYTLGYTLVAVRNYVVETPESPAA